MLFLFAIDLMAESFNYVGKGVAESILVATSNPFIGLFIGLLITAIIQSSSTSTSMIVAAVASGSITLADAVPMIMGANIGTTLTSTIVALGYITSKNEFKRALAAGTVHDFFNILTTLILFPLEYYYGFLSYFAQQIANFFLDPSLSVSDAAIGFKLFDAIPITKFIITGVGNGLITIIISFVLLIASLKYLSKKISNVLIANPKDNLKNLIFNNPWKSFGFGAGITAAVQSSSITTSLVIPFVATNRIELKNAMPFILGANIGTTITAFIAVLFKSNAAMSIAVTHLLFNVIGVLIFLPFPVMRNLIISMASRFGSMTFKHRLIGFTYIIFTFFIIPFALIFFNKTNTKITELTYLNQNNTERVVIYKSAVSKDYPFTMPQNESDFGTLSDNLVHVNRKNNIVFFNKDFFIFNDVGFCWDNENSDGKFNICITDIEKSIEINESQTLDSVYIFDLQYYNKAELDSISYTYKVSAIQNALYQTIKKDKNGKIIAKETLSSFVEKY
ncbi:Na/Pi symporter [Fulvivirga lutea]|uniref:Na/Pi cotransporter family protein n=1 Tax=Fulvivirga lutea TaxID=2810512 RepID=A0A974WIY8_9BACT|nr:Na/Pi symporter [Fulvivirga lutea]QSE98618.1 Na/Pi cotransporter family protein [Fulvivirga lutea]